MQIAALEPQSFVLRGLPHIALLALPRAGILGRFGAKPPAFTHQVSCFLTDEISYPPIHRTVTGSVNHKIGIQFGAVFEHHGVLGKMVYLAVREFDLSLCDEVSGSDVDVVA